MYYTVCVWEKMYWKMKLYFKSEDKKVLFFKKLSVLIFTCQVPITINKYKVKVAKISHKIRPVILDFPVCHLISCAVTTYFVQNFVFLCYSYSC